MTSGTPAKAPAPNNIRFIVWKTDRTAPRGVFPPDRADMASLKEDALQ